MNNSQSMTATGQSNASDQSSAPLTLRNVNRLEAIARFAGDEDRYRHWLIEFISHGPAAADEIRQAIANGSQDDAIMLVHALKGRTGMLGMVELHSITLSLEMALSNDEPSTFWLEELEFTVDEMSKEISAVLGERSA